MKFLTKLLICSCTVFPVVLPTWANSGGFHLFPPPQICTDLLRGLANPKQLGISRIGIVRTYFSSDYRARLLDWARTTLVSFREVKPGERILARAQMFSPDQVGEAISEIQKLNASLPKTSPAQEFVRQIDNLGRPDLTAVVEVIVDLLGDNSKFVEDGSVKESREFHALSLIGTLAGIEQVPLLVEMYNSLFIVRAKERVYYFNPEDFNFAFNTYLNFGLTDLPRLKFNRYRDLRDQVKQALIAIFARQKFTSENERVEAFRLLQPLPFELQKQIINNPNFHKSIGKDIS